MGLPLRVLVVGAGICGLACAVALRARGFPVDVVERSGEVEPDTVTLTGRCVSALADLGVLNECRTAGDTRLAPAFGGTFDASGEPIGFGHPGAPGSDLPAAIMLYRPALIEVLAAAARDAGARLRMPCTVAALEQFADSVFVSFDDGGTGEYGIVVAADGVRSATRGLVWGDTTKPTPAGAVGIGWSAAGLPAGEPGIYYGRDGTMVAVGALPGDVTYLSTFAETGCRSGAAEDGRELLRKVLSGYTAPYLCALRERLDEDQHVVLRPWEWLWMPTWRQGRVVLVGDAAHATTHCVPAGAGLALIDAVVLAEELATAPDSTIGLTGFVDRRFERVRLVVRTSVDMLRLRRTGDQTELRQLLDDALSALVGPY